MGLEGEDPETINVSSIKDRVHNIREKHSLRLANKKAIAFTDNDLILHKKKASHYIRMA